LIKQKVLVTGGAGFIGSHLVDELIRQHYHVIVIDNESAEENDHFYWNEEAENHKVDILDPNISVQMLFEDVKCVFHLAARSRIQPAMNNPVLASEVNFVGTLRVLQACRRYNIPRMIYSTTSSYYGLKNLIPLKENMERDCLNVYSVSKVAGEDLCKMYYKTYGIGTICLRYFNVYGSRQPTRGIYAPVIGLFMKQHASGNPMTIVGDGNQTRDYTHVSDVVRANIMAFLNGRDSYGESFNVGCGKQTSVNEIAEKIGVNTQTLPERMGEARDTLADISKIYDHLEWEPKVFLEDWFKSDEYEDLYCMMDK